MIRSLVICHFYNEEYLLPFWLNHHVKIFDHGVMINNGSTDRSVEIIKKIAPNWDVIDSNLAGFDALMLDFIVQKEEARFDCWKICLNVSEFLVGDIGKIINDADKHGCTAMETAPYIMFDPEIDIDPLEGKSLISQKPFGFYDSWLYDFIMRDQKIRKIILLFMGKVNWSKRRARLFHKHQIGGYSVGRHNWAYMTRQNKNLKLYWYGYSPNTVKFINRKKSFGATLPKGELKIGQHHRLTDKKYKKNYFLHKLFYFVFGKKLKE